MLGLDEAIVDAVLKDWQTAPVNTKMRAILGYLEKLTLTPDSVCKKDLDNLYAAGLTDTAIFEAVYVCFMFNIIDRLADAFDFNIPNADLVKNDGRFLYHFGYSSSKYMP